MFTHHTSWPCGLGGKRDNESDDWNKVTCPGCLLKQPRSGDVVHYWPIGHNQTMCGASMLSTSTRYVTDWVDVTCGECKLEQPAQKVAGRVEYVIPGNVQYVDALLAATDRRERAARKVVKWTARLEAALAEERRLTDVPVPLWPAPEATVQHLHGIGAKAMCGAPFSIIPTDDRVEIVYCSECEQMWSAHNAQLESFFSRMRELRAQGALGLREARQAALDEAHGEALEVTRWIPPYPKPMPY